jgi:hypothetical protein
VGKTRLEAFSDGVIAIIITIMVLEMKVPHDPSLAGLAPLVPVFLSYVLSFIYVGIYWNNHHHMLHACGNVTGGVLWADLPPYLVPHPELEFRYLMHVSAAMLPVPGDDCSKSCAA